ncbi:S1C family serine protease [Nocardia sp. CDC160]|uniref:S1C family serine protease n=1 Tax=Nocardia sp. CDC160 TaxID=3112166 RepID=UPI002DBC1705|nr:trypsin-like peptidase domain-containing protein [Nocardia sp. CDC160]MEC3915889.1 trypsin-like peptidase domain-containing protein [Nocardia sp. CDC160]
MNVQSHTRANGSVRSRTIRAAAAAVVALTATLGLVACGPNTLVPGNPVAQTPGQVTQSQPIDFSTPPADLDSAAQAVVPGIVDVNTELGLQNGEGAGTGIVLTSDGVVLTNNHVVEGATKISVTDLGNGRTYDATVLGFDRSEDMAVIKLSGASGLTTAPLGDSDRVAVGDAVVGVGNAGGRGTPTAAGGKVTALNRAITASDDSTGSSEQLTGLIQVAANIEPGDSGGPLVNSAGQVIGMDTAASKGFRFSISGGEGFAIPINKALAVAKQIQSGQSSDRVHIGDTAFIGVSVTSTGGGAQIRGVVQGGPADSLGLQARDVITGLDNHTITSATDLTNTMDQHHPGDTVTLKWTDGYGQAESAQVQLAKGPVG